MSKDQNDFLARIEQRLASLEARLSKRVTTDLDYIPLKGNLVLHPNDEPLEASERDVEIILLLTINLVEWYFTGYLPEPVEARGDESPLQPNPYRGLHAFGEADAAHYFGREPDIADVLAAVERQPLVAVVGPSGSGKSSLAFAGVAAELDQRGDWAIATFRPRARLEAELARALVVLWATDPVCNAWLKLQAWPSTGPPVRSPSARPCARACVRARLSACCSSPTSSKSSTPRACQRSRSKTSSTC